ncbi:hypothetical protein [Herbidospora sp. RD11066]
MARAANPPRPPARSAARSSSAATSSSGPRQAAARCQARLSTSAGRVVASASAGVQVALGRRSQQLQRLGLGQPGGLGDRQARQAREFGAGGEHQPDPLGVGAAADEREHPERLVVEPLGVVDAADDRPFGRDPGQQVEHREAHQLAIGRRPRVQPEGDPDRLPLHRDQPVTQGKEGHEQPVQPRHSRRPDTGGGGHVIEQRGRADARLTPQDDHPAQPSPDGDGEPVGQIELRSPADDRHGSSSRAVASCLREVTASFRKTLRRW